MVTFRREVIRHELVRRELSVVGSRDVAPGIRRLTLTGDDLATWTGPGPDDHIKMFFPTSEAPAGRDFTPRAHRPDVAELDVDFVLHDDPGPASGFAASAAPGTTVNMGGPRGSKLAPQDAAGLLLVADPTALPAAARWLEALPDVPATLIAVADEDVVRAYLGELGGDRLTLICCASDDEVLETVRATTVDEGTFVWAAGEAGTLVPIRRYWRRELGLSRAQVSVSGYWRRGVAGHDHHAPVDASDPD